MARWFPRYRPLLLPFAPSPTDIREWNVELDPPTTAVQVPFTDGQLKVSLHRILFEAGLARTQAVSASDPRSWFALYKYGSDFAGTGPRMRLYSGAGLRDPRDVAATSEDVATGITCYILREHMGLDHIADAWLLLRGPSPDLGYVNPASQERPDYFCLDTNGQAVLAESKGATGTRSAISPRIDPEGWDQVQNVQPLKHQLRPNCGRVVIGTHVCIEGRHPRTETTTIIKDPPAQQDSADDPTSDTPIRVAYAKVFRFAGWDGIAERLLLGLPFQDVVPPVDTIVQQGLVHLGGTPFGGRVALTRDVARALWMHNEHSLTETIPNRLREFRAHRPVIDNGYSLPNGVVVFCEE